MIPTVDDRDTAAIGEKAAWWFVTNRSGPGTPAEREAFSAWLRESPAHVREYLAIATLARDFASIVQESTADQEWLAPAGRDEQSGTNVVDLDAFAVRPEPGADRAVNARSPLWRNARGAVAALAASIIVGILFVASGRGGEGLGQSYRTGHGQQQTVQLEDGSVLRLNSDSKVTVRFSPVERRVDLDAGQALFHVAHDAGRQFRVVAGGVSVVAIGTRFDVYRRRAATVVTVVEGKVAVARESRILQLPIVSRPRASTAGVVRLVAGEQLRVDQDAALPELLERGVSISPTEAVNVDEAVAWVRQQIIFEDKALAEVAEEFNRYGEVPIRIEDPELRLMRVTGILTTYDREAFIGFLQRLDGVRVIETPTAVHVTRKARTGILPGGMPESSGGHG